MKYLFASDIHGSAFYCRRLLEAFDTEGADKLILLGDILYHGPRNDLPKDYAPKEVLAMLNERKDSILCVRGNCDGEVDQMVLEFPVLADYAVLFVENPSMTIYLTHGHHFNIDNPLPMAEGSIMMYGHTHVTLDEIRNNRRFINPGSVSIPKQNTGHGYIVLEDGVFTRKLLEE